MSPGAPADPVLSPERKAAAGDSLGLFGDLVDAYWADLEDRLRRKAAPR